MRQIIGAAMIKGSAHNGWGAEWPRSFRMEVALP